MKKIYLYGALLLSVFGVTFSDNTYAEPDTVEAEATSFEAPALNTIEPLAKELKTIHPNITVDTFISVGDKVLFDAGGSELLPPSAGAPVYSWSFGDNTKTLWGERIQHAYEQPGRYMIQLNVRQGNEREFIRHEVIVFNRKGILITESQKDISELVNRAGEHGIWLKGIPFKKAETGISAEENFARLLQENIDFLGESDIIIFDTKSASGFQNFAQWWQKVSPEKRFNLNKKMWVHISEGSLEQTRKLIQPSFHLLNPPSVILTRPEAIDLVFQSHANEIVQKLENRGLESILVDGESNAPFFLVFSRLTTYFISNGVSQSVIFLLLAVPFIVFVIAFFRQFVGIKTFGVFAPLMLSLSFVLLGLEFGFLSFAIVMVVSSLIRQLFSKIEILYIPKVSLLLSALSISFFLVLGLAVYFNTSINLALAVFPMLVMSTISEKFLSAQSQGGLRSAAIIAGETVIVSLIAYFLVSWDWIENGIIAMPEIIILPIIGNVWLGRFTGLRLSEYFKFGALFRDETQE